MLRGIRVAYINTDIETIVILNRDVNAASEELTSITIDLQQEFAALTSKHWVDNTGAIFKERNIDHIEEEIIDITKSLSIDINNELADYRRRVEEYLNYD